MSLSQAAIDQGVYMSRVFAAELKGDHPDMPSRTLRTVNALVAYTRSGQSTEAIDFAKRLSTPAEMAVRAMDLDKLPFLFLETERLIARVMGKTGIETPLIIGSALASLGAYMVRK